MTKLTPEDLAAIDHEMTEWGHQGFEDIAAIVHDDRVYPAEVPVLSDDDILHQKVHDMKVQGGDVFIALKSGEVLHYRMTVVRL